MTEVYHYGSNAKKNVEQKMCSAYCNFQIVFQSKCKLINFFPFKDKIPVFLRPGIAYKFIIMFMGLQI